jgi:hypothetical protein
VYGDQFESVWANDAEEARSERMRSTASRREERYGEDVPSDSDLAEEQR